MTKRSHLFKCMTSTNSAPNKPAPTKGPSQTLLLPHNTQKRVLPLQQIMITILLFLLCAGFSHGAKNEGSLEGRKGQWQMLLNNTGVVGMHTALTSKNTIIMFDQTEAGPSGYPLHKRFNGSRCNTRSHNDVVDSTCYAHSVEYDISANRVRPLRLDSDPWCSSGSFLSNGTLLQTGGYGRGAKRIRFYRPCGNHQCHWIQSRKSLSDERWYASSQILPDHDRVVIVGGRRTFTYEFIPKISPTEKSFDLPFLHKTNERNAEGNNLYPFLHLSSDGNLFIFANRDSILLNPRRNRVIKTFPRIPGDGSRNYPSSGSSVMLPLDHSDNFHKVEVMVCGGSATGALRAASNRKFLEGLRSCGRMVITGNDNKWEMEYMPEPRLLHDMLILPNGNILIINGAKHGCAGHRRIHHPASLGTCPGSVADFIFFIWAARDFLGKKERITWAKKTNCLSFSPLFSFSLSFKHSFSEFWMYILL